MTPIDLASLPFDADAMLAGLKPWVECESPSKNAAAVNQMVDIAARDFAAAGARVERIPGIKGYGDAIRVSLWPGRVSGPGILVLGHFDTVHPIGTLDTLPWRLVEDRCFGPGILDMKSGNYLLLEAFRLLKAAGIDPMLPVTALFTGDEEVGSPISRSLVEAEALRAKYVLVLEPARPDGSVVTGRYAIRRIQILTEGKPTHAGNNPRNGVSAIREMAEIVSIVEDLSTDEVTCSVGIIGGGFFSNCVASSCSAEALIMARSQGAMEGFLQQLDELRPRREGAQLTISPGLERPLWRSSGDAGYLFGQAKGIAGKLGFELTQTTSGGGSDGNFTGALGVQTLDGLGARGAGLHTQNEYIVVDSLPERGRLLAGLLATMD